MLEPVVTISASYGAGGSVIAPALAERLGWPFVDRMVTSEVSSQANAFAARSEEHLSADEPTPPSLLAAILTGAARIGVLTGPEPVIAAVSELHARTDVALRSLVDGGGGVVLGWAAAVVLAERARTLHVRLDGPVERRIVRASEIEQVGIETARDRQAHTDRARNHLVRHLYGRDPEDATLYHLRLDTTVLALDDVVTLLARLVELAFPDRRVTTAAPIPR